MNILLIEPAYKTKYPPLGLMKISTYHKCLGDKVTYIKDVKRNKQLDMFRDSPKLSPDIIYITSLFTYHLNIVIESINHYKFLYPNAEIKVGGIAASLMPDYIKNHTGVTPHIGLLDFAEDCPPDYSIPPNIDSSVTFTSRGCPRSCAVCAVSLHEPEYFMKKHWINDIDSSKPKVLFWDNNWLASPNFPKDIEQIKQLRLGDGLKGVRRYIDFNQGLDCRLMDKDKAGLLETIRIYPIRFGYDNPSHEGYIQQAIEVVENCKFKCVLCTVLYNTDNDYDTPEYFYYRINELNKLGARSYPVRYTPLNCLDRKYVGKHWDNDLLRGIQITVGFLYRNGVIRPHRDFFLDAYTDNAKSFVNKMYSLTETERKEKKNYPKETSGCSISTNQCFEV